jgi:ATP-dependent DNA helicase RecQ
LYSYQKEVLHALIVDKKSVFVCQRTGRGKSLCYEAFTTACKSDDAVVIVISPLIAIVEDQVNMLNSLGIKAVMLGKNDVIDSKARTTAEFQYVYASPEILLGRNEWRTALKSPAYQDKVKLLVVDEAHLVIQW